MKFIGHCRALLGRLACLAPPFRARALGFLLGIGALILTLLFTSGC